MVWCRLLPNAGDDQSAWVWQFLGESQPSGVKNLTYFSERLGCGPRQSCPPCHRSGTAHVMVPCCLSIPLRRWARHRSGGRCLAASAARAVGLLQTQQHRSAWLHSCCCSWFLGREGKVSSGALTQAAISALTAEKAGTGHESKGKLHRRGAGRWDEHLEICSGS